MNQDWILHIKETRRTFSSATWVPLRASYNDEHGEVQAIGYVSEFFGCGSVAFPPKHREVAERLGWSDIGIGRSVEPYAYEDGYYSSIEQYQHNDKEPIGVQLVFEHPQPVVGGRLWILNPDLVVALHLIKDRTNWVRPEEDFVVVAREVLDEKGHHRLIEIKREFLIDYATNFAVYWIKEMRKNYETDILSDAALQKALADQMGHDDFDTTLKHYIDNAAAILMLGGTSEAPSRSFSLESMLGHLAKTGRCQQRCRISYAASA